MSGEEAGTSCCCASCGKAEVDDVKLKDCDECNLVRYCGDECQRDHRSEHKEECKKRAAELRDELLFKQPEGSCYGDCPICCLPLSLVQSESSFKVCCSKLICNGCMYANQKREIEMKLQVSCPFCRKATPKTKKECERRNMQRAKANDPLAMHQKGVEDYEEGDYRSAFEYYAKAAELGDVNAHHSLSKMYQFGKGVEKDERKRIYHLEEAAIAGHADARCDLGRIELNDKYYSNFERAMNHFIIAAKQGHVDSMKFLTWPR